MFMRRNTLLSVSRPWAIAKSQNVPESSDESIDLFYCASQPVAGCDGFCTFINVYA